MLRTTLLVIIVPLIVRPTVGAVLLMTQTIRHTSEPTSTPKHTNTNVTYTIEHTYTHNHQHTHQHTRTRTRLTHNHHNTQTQHTQTQTNALTSTNTKHHDDEITTHRKTNPRQPRG